MDLDLHWCVYCERQITLLEPATSDVEGGAVTQSPAPQSATLSKTTACATKARTQRSAKTGHVATRSVSQPRRNGSSSKLPAVRRIASNAAVENAHSHHHAGDSDSSQGHSGPSRRKSTMRIDLPEPAPIADITSTPSETPFAPELYCSEACQRADEQRNKAMTVELERRSSSCSSLAPSVIEGSYFPAQTSMRRSQSERGTAHSRRPSASVLDAASRSASAGALGSAAARQLFPGSALAAAADEKKVKVKGRERDRPRSISALAGLKAMTPIRMEGGAPLPPVFNKSARSDDGWSSSASDAGLRSDASSDALSDMSGIGRRARSTSAASNASSTGSIPRPAIPLMTRLTQRASPISSYTEGSAVHGVLAKGDSDVNLASQTARRHPHQLSTSSMPFTSGGSASSYNSSCPSTASSYQRHHSEHDSESNRARKPSSGLRPTLLESVRSHSTEIHGTRQSEAKESVRYSASALESYGLYMTARKRTPSNPSLATFSHYSQSPSAAYGEHVSSSLGTYGHAGSQHMQRAHSHQLPRGAQTPGVYPSAHFGGDGRLISDIVRQKAQERTSWIDANSKAAVDRTPTQTWARRRGSRRSSSALAQLEDESKVPIFSSTNGDWGRQFSRHGARSLPRSESPYAAAEFAQMERWRTKDVSTYDRPASRSSLSDEDDGSDDDDGLSQSGYDSNSVSGPSPGAGSRQHVLPLTPGIEPPSMYETRRRLGHEEDKVYTLPAMKGGDANRKKLFYFDHE